MCKCIIDEWNRPTLFDTMSRQNANRIVRCLHFQGFLLLFYILVILYARGLLRPLFRHSSRPPHPYHTPPIPITPSPGPVQHSARVEAQHAVVHADEATQGARSTRPPPTPPTHTPPPHQGLLVWSKRLSSTPPG